MNYEERSKSLSDYMAKVVDAKTELESAFTRSIDSASEFGYEMGVMSEQARIYEEIDAISSSLTDEEEDAKLALEIVKQVVFRKDEEDE
jgi:phosphopantetheine adenylyltransferase